MSVLKQLYQINKIAFISCALVKLYKVPLFNFFRRDFLNNQDFFKKRNRYSIRKITAGAASVIVGVTLFVNANEADAADTAASEQPAPAENTATSTEQPKADTIQTTEQPTEKTAEQPATEQQSATASKTDSAQPAADSEINTSTPAEQPTQNTSTTSAKETAAPAAPTEAPTTEPSVAPTADNQTTQAPNADQAPAEQPTAEQFTAQAAPTDAVNQQPAYDPNAAQVSDANTAENATLGDTSGQTDLANASKSAQDYSNQKDSSEALATSPNTTARFAAPTS